MSLKLWESQKNLNFVGTIILLGDHNYVILTGGLRKSFKGGK
jgi:hypothetical protein